MRDELLSNFLNLNESTTKIAVIVKGNPKYINDPRIKNIANIFYEKIKSILIDRGYIVEFDAGEPMTRPNTKAAVWVAHSRGADRLNYAPATVRTLEIQTKGKTVGKSNDEIGFDLAHYSLSKSDIDNLHNI